MLRFGLQGLEPLDLLPLFSQAERVEFFRPRAGMGNSMSVGVTTWPPQWEPVTIVPAETVGGGVGEFVRNSGWICDWLCEVMVRSEGRPVVRCAESELIGAKGGRSSDDGFGIAGV